MKKLLTTTIFIPVCMLLLVSFSLASDSKPTVTAEMLEKVQQLLADRAGNYAGSDVCQVCHGLPSIGETYHIDTWQSTLHAQAVRDPDLDPGVVADFDFQSGLDLATDTDFSAYGADAPVLGYDPGDTADPADGTSGYRVTIGAVTYSVNRTHGGNWKQQFQTRIGNSYYFLPIQYNVETSDWVVYEGDNWYDGGGSPLFTSSSTLFDDIDKGDSFERNCAACHMVGLELSYNDGTGEYTASYREMNIGCESCHGPGGAPTHVLYGLSGKGLDPANLDAERGNEVCGQCHNRGQGALSVGGKTLAYPWSPAGGFTPGSALSNFFVPIHPVDDPAYFWPDGKHGKSNEMQYLDFYQSSKPTYSHHKLVCWECHNPHGTDNRHDVIDTVVEGELVIATDIDDNTLCLSCHATHGDFAGVSDEMIADPEGHLEEIAAVITGHSKHSYDPLNANGTNGTGRCTQCHMPETATSAEEYDIHSHTFEAISGHKTLDTQAEGGMPNACATSCHRNPVEPNVPNFGLNDAMLTAWNEESDVGAAAIVGGNEEQWASDTSRYAGVEYCNNCHGEYTDYAGDKWHGWMGTVHAESYDGAAPYVKSNPSCMPCHSTGWDEENPDGGFDDYYTTGDSTNFHLLANVQCEGCHKAGSRHPIPAFASVEIDRSSDGCGVCHEGTHHPYYSEWQQSLHAISDTTSANRAMIATNPGCSGCHTMQGFLQFVQEEGEEPHVDVSAFDGAPMAITCPACHDPHALEHEGQLRMAPNELCKKCHNPEGAEPPATPHHATAYVYDGVGGAEFEGEVYGNSPHTDLIEEACPRCHVYMTPFQAGPPEVPTGTGHTFNPRLEACQTEECHPGLETFNRDGVQTEIDSLFHVLEEALIAVEDSSTEDFTFALFNYQFLEADGSRGIHNTAYTKKLLWDSIERLTGEAPSARYKGAEYCNNCHGGESSVAGDQYEGWVNTRHAVAYDAEGRADLPYWVGPCNKCHTVGYDTGVDNGGFDDAVTAGEVENTKNVQCEGCHTAGSLHPGEFASLHLGLDTGVCSECHVLAYEQWSETGHSRSLAAASGRVVTTSSCQPCHIGEIFLGRTVEDVPSPIGCAACHDPHDASVSDSQLRFSAREICQRCHYARGAQPPSTPRYTQAEMLEGEGGYEYPGVTYTDSPHNVVTPEKCVTCHMYSEEYASAAFTTELSDHTFMPRLEACQECHPGLENFDLYGVQTEIEDLLTILGDALAAASSEDSLTEAFTNALFNYRFVTADGSRGVHNADYAMKLLEDAIADFAPHAVRVSTCILPEDYALNQNYPNPFNPETKVDFALPQSGPVRLVVYNVLGQMVRELVNATREAGYHSVMWDGKNSAGDNVVSGVYLYRLEAGQFVSTKKMTLIK